MNEDLRVLVVDDSEFFGTLVAGELAEQYGMATDWTTVRFSLPVASVSTRSPA